jgi:transaldolase
MRVQSKPGYWVSQVTRDVLSSRTLLEHIAERTVTGLVFDTAHYTRAIRSTAIYDGLIAGSLQENKLGEELLFELAVEDIRCAADLLRPTYEESDGLDGWASMDVSPLTVHDAAACAAAAKCIYDRVFRPNVFIRIPGTPEALPAIEATTFLGVPVHVTLLFSCEQYLAAALAYIRGLERRIAAGSRADVRSAASVATALPDGVVAESVPPKLRGGMVAAMGETITTAHRKLLSSRRWKHVSDHGARPQTLCWDGAPGNEETGLLCGAVAIPSLSEITSEGPMRARAGLECDLPWKVSVSEPASDRSDGAQTELQPVADRSQSQAFAADVRAWIDLLSAIANKSAALATSAIGRRAGTSHADTLTIS